MVLGYIVNDISENEIRLEIRIYIYTVGYPNDLSFIGTNKMDKIKNIKTLIYRKEFNYRKINIKCRKNIIHGCHKSIKRGGSEVRK